MDSILDNNMYKLLKKPVEFGQAEPEELPKIMPRKVDKYCDLLSKLVQDANLWKKYERPNSLMYPIRLRYIICGYAVRGILIMHKKSKNTFTNYFSVRFVRMFKFPKSKTAVKVFVLERNAPLTIRYPPLPDLQVISSSDIQPVIQEQQTQVIPLDRRYDVNLIEEEREVVETIQNVFDIRSSQISKTKHGADGGEINQVRQFLRESGLGVEGHENISTWDELRQVLDKELSIGRISVPQQPRLTRSLQSPEQYDIPHVTIVTADVHAPMERDTADIPVSHNLAQPTKPSSQSPDLFVQHLTITADVHAPMDKDVEIADVLVPQNVHVEERLDYDIRPTEPTTIVEKSVEQIVQQIQLPQRRITERLAEVEMFDIQPTPTERRVPDIEEIIQPIVELRVGEQIYDIPNAEREVSEHTVRQPTIEEPVQPEIQMHFIADEVPRETIQHATRIEEVAEPVIELARPPLQPIQDFVDESVRKKPRRKIFLSERQLKNRLRKKIKPLDYISHYDRLENYEQSLHDPFDSIFSVQHDDPIEDDDDLSNLFDRYERPFRPLSPDSDLFDDLFCTVFETPENIRTDVSTTGRRRLTTFIAQQDDIFKESTSATKSSREPPKISAMPIDQINIPSMVPPAVQQTEDSLHFMLPPFIQQAGDSSCLMVPPTIQAVESSREVTEIVLPQSRQATTNAERTVSVSEIPTNIQIQGIAQETEQQKKIEESYPARTSDPTVVNLPQVTLEKGTEEPRRVEKRISIEDLIQRIEDLWIENYGNITFEDLCPIQITNRFTVACTLSTLIIMDMNKLISLKQELGQWSPRSLIITKCWN